MACIGTPFGALYVFKVTDLFIRDVYYSGLLQKQFEHPRDIVANEVMLGRRNMLAPLPISISKTKFNVMSADLDFGLNAPWLVMTNLLRRVAYFRVYERAIFHSIATVRRGRNISYQKHVDALRAYILQIRFEIRGRG